MFSNVQIEVETKATIVAVAASGIGFVEALDEKVDLSSYVIPLDGQRIHRVGVGDVDFTFQVATFPGVEFRPFVGVLVFHFGWHRDDLALVVHKGDGIGGGQVESVGKVVPFGQQGVTVVKGAPFGVEDHLEIVASIEKVDDVKAQHFGAFIVGLKTSWEGQQ